EVAVRAPEPESFSGSCSLGVSGVSYSETGETGARRTDQTATELLVQGRYSWKDWRAAANGRTTLLPLSHSAETLRFLELGSIVGKRIHEWGGREVRAGFGL